MSTSEQTPAQFAMSAVEKEMADLRKENQEHRITISNYERKLDVYHKRILELEEALRVYADRNFYLLKPSDNDGALIPGSQPYQNDHGEKARQVLERKDGDGH